MDLIILTKENLKSHPTTKRPHGHLREKRESNFSYQKI
jgi:hypothetical protein